MTDNKDTDGKTIRGSRTMTLNLKRTVDAGHVQQNFSAGRKKTVVVEKKRKRIITRPGEEAPTPEAPASQDAAPKPAPTPPKKASQPKSAPARGRQNARPRRSGGGGGGSSSDNLSLSNAEMDARTKALQMARERDVVEAAQRVKDETARIEREKLDAIEAEKRAAEEALKPKVEKTEVKAEVEKKPAVAKTARPAAKAAKPAVVDQASAEAQAGKRGEYVPAKTAPQAKETLRDRRPKLETPTPAKTKGGSQRRSRKLTIQNALDEGGRQRSLASLRRRQQKQRRAAASSGPAEKITREVILPEVITIQELANRMAERAVDVIKFLMKQGQMHELNDVIDTDTAELIAEEFGHTVKRVSEADVEEDFIGRDDEVVDLKSRAPVVTIMGHVDHGKTSLLDAIREANVVSGEAGGITQHIGAYQVDKGDLGVITFIDTPGHAAFTEMRARGAKVTDIVVLVVAANDGVMPQTIEAINHAKAAGVPMIVAINKCDLPAADPQKVRTDLLQHEVIVEEMSGDVQDVEVSAHTGQGLDALLEAIALQAEILELKANPDRAAQGAVIEAQLDVGRGPVATVLVQNGTLRQGDIFVVGEQWGKVRALINDKGDRVDEAGPSVPVEVLGLNGTPEAGDVLNVVDTEAQAREIAEYREKAAKEKRAVAGAATTLEQLMQKAKDDKDVAELPILVKADVQGSAEAIVQTMAKIGNDEVRVRVLHSGVGAITESDIGLAEASGSPVFGFNVRANAPARQAANQKGVEIRYYSVIYDLVDDVKAAASGLLSAEVQEDFIGYGTIKEVFKVSNIGKVAGCLVTEGVARRSAGVRLLRDNVVIHEGTLKTLKRFKDEVPEVQSGQECGMAFENYEDIREGDVIEIFERKEVERTLD